MTLKSIILFLSVFFLVQTSQSQDLGSWAIDSSLPVLEQDRLVNAWAGGMNFVQFSEMDLDGDGREDLVTFDRDGDKLSTFINKNGVYTHAPEYEKDFPPLRNWMLLADYNCDGLKDIFAYNLLGMEVWQNTSTAEGMSWEKQVFDYRTPEGLEPKEGIKADVGLEYDVNINVNFQDIPAIVDVDGDGALDILTFGLATALPEGVTIEYFRNRSSCGLDFYREDRCWGGFAEAYTDNAVYLQVCGADPETNRVPRKKMHLGSSLLAFDATGNGLLDMLLGDITFETGVLVLNSGTDEQAWMTDQDPQFPSDNISVNLENFPGFFLVDSDGDGAKEIVACPATVGSENYNNIWRYEDVNPGGIPQYELAETDFLQSGMVDVGEKSRPVLYDIDGDGDLDLFVANYGYYNKGGSYTSSIAYYQWVGNRSNGSYVLRSRDYGDLAQYGLLNMHPAFADLDNDGQVDLLIGTTEGKVRAFKGRGGDQYDPVAWGNNINVGSHATPKIFDLDNDGVDELLVGNRQGQLHHYNIIEDGITPLFTKESERWLDLDLSGINLLGAHLVPELYRDSKGQLHLLLGTSEGDIYHYLVADDSATLITEHISGYYSGSHSAPAVGRVGQNKLYLFTGSAAGGLQAFSTKDNNAYFENWEWQGDLILVPNPAREQCQIVLREADNQVLSWELFNPYGQYLKGGLSQQVDLSSLATGIYTIYVETTKGGQALQLMVR